MMPLLSLLNGLPRVVSLMTAVQKARQGDRAAIAYLKDRGIVDAADLLVPGMGTSLQDAVESVRQTIDGSRFGGSSAGDGDPWITFVSGLLHLRSAGHVIVGPTGSAKTSLATRLAWRLAQELPGYEALACNFYLHDRPSFMRPISMEVLVGWMELLKKHLRSLEEQANGGRVTIAPLPPTRKIIVIDEMMLAMSSDYHDPDRVASLQALASCRHLDWHVLYLGQWLGQVPLPLLGQCLVWIKEPAGREAEIDRPSDPLVSSLWARASHDFGLLSSQRWYHAPYLDRRSWAHLSCPRLEALGPWTGMVPFSLYKEEITWQPGRGPLTEPSDRWVPGVESAAG